MVVYLLQLIRVKKAIIQTMKPVEYKHLLVSLKTLEESITKIKELENEIKKLKLELASEITQ